MRYGLICAVALAVLTLSPIARAATYGTGDFQISAMSYSTADNLHVRVWGMQPMSYCPGNPGFAYINEGDSGAKARIAALIAAHAAGQTVSLVVEPAVFTDGQLYCRIIDFTIRN